MNACSAQQCTLCCPPFVIQQTTEMWIRFSPWIFSKKKKNPTYDLNSYFLCFMIPKKQNKKKTRSKLPHQEFMTLSFNHAASFFSGKNISLEFLMHCYIRTLTHISLFGPFNFRILITWTDSSVIKDVASLCRPRARWKGKRWKCSTVSRSEADWSPAAILVRDRPVIDRMVLLRRSRPDPLHQRFLPRV